MLCRTRRQGRNGAVIPLVAVCLIIICGMLAFVIDGGLMLDARRKCQIVADLACLAAVSDLFDKYNTNQGKDVSNSAINCALDCANQNGFNNDGTTNSVNVYTSQSNTNTYSKYSQYSQYGASTVTIPTGYVEVVVTYQTKSYFSGVFGAPTFTVVGHTVARAFYQATGVGNPGILLLDPTGSGSFKANGNAMAITGNGAVVINSSASDGMQLIGNSTVKAQSYYFSGAPGYTLTSNAELMDSSGNVLSSTSTLINSNVAPTPDPLSALPVPYNGVAPSYGTYSGNKSGTFDSSTLKLTQDTTTLTPGSLGGLSASGNANVVLQPGIYYVGDGGFSFTGNGNLTVSGPTDPTTGNGVLIYQSGTAGTISINGNGQVNIPPPTLGTYQGISIFQDRTSTQTVSVTGNGTSTLNSTTIGGSFYAKKGTLNVVGNGSTVDKLGSQYISYNLQISGNGNFTLDYAGASVPPPPPVRQLQLVE